MRPLHDHYTPYGLANLEVDGGLSGTLASPWLRPLRCSGKTIRAHGWPRQFRFETEKPIYLPTV